MASALRPICAEAGAAAAEVDAVDQRVDRGRGGAAGHGDRGVVAAAEPHPRPRRRQPFRAPAPAARTRPSRLSHRRPLGRQLSLLDTSLRCGRSWSGANHFCTASARPGREFGTRPPRSKRVRLAIQLGLALARLRLPRPHRRRPVVGDQGQGRPLPCRLADPGLRRPADLLRAQRARLGPDPALPRLPDRGRPGAGRLGQPLLARYVPGSVLYVLGRVLLSERAGVPRRITIASIVYEQAISRDLGDRRRRLLLHQPPRPAGPAAALGGPAADPGGDRDPAPARLRPARRPGAARLRPRAAAGGDLAARRDRAARLLLAQLGGDRGRHLLRRPLGQHDPAQRHPHRRLGAGARLRGRARHPRRPGRASASATPPSPGR